MKVTVHVNSVDFIIYDKRWPVYKSPGRAPLGEIGEAQKNLLATENQGRRGLYTGEINA